MGKKAAWIMLSKKWQNKIFLSERQEEKGVRKDEMVGWHHQLKRHESEQAPGDGERQGNLVCCSPWGHTESDTTERLNKTKKSEAQIMDRKKIWSGTVS